MDEKANKGYKDTAFRMLFGNESKSAELYNAISGTNYGADAITMTTLQNPLFVGGLRNDVSFSIEDKFVILCEHQSTISPNIPIRFLWYVAEIYKNRIDKKSIYKAKPLEIENSEFIVLYNGKASYPEKSVVKLSDLFKIKDGRNPGLELVVAIYNVNKGHNSDIMGQSKTLGDYAEFVKIIRDYEKNGLELTEALQKAVEYCIKNNILREFLEQNGGEIVSILNMEWNLDDAIKVRVEEKAEDIAEEMLLADEPIGKIVKYTKLTEERILELKKKLKAQLS